LESLWFQNGHFSSGIHATISGLFMKPDTMTTRERFHAVMNFQPFDRLPLWEWATWWDLTVNRWEGEGLPAFPRTRDDNNSDLSWIEQIAAHFGHDIYIQDWLNPFLPTLWERRSGHGASIVTSMDEYEEVLPLLFPDPAKIVDRARWEARTARQARGEVVLWFSLNGFFWFPRILLGIEEHFYALYDQPELVHRMNADLAEWNVRCIDEVCKIAKPDFMTFLEDMSYNHGPMLSEKLFDEFMLPYYHQVIPRLHERNILAISDSDGDITTAAPWFERAGLDGILPLERQSRVDIDTLRRNHPRMRFIGHYDKLVMAKGEAAIRGEFERLLPAAARGGFIVSVDHQTPPHVSYEDYKLFMRLYREYAELAGARSGAA